MSGVRDTLGMTWGTVLPGLLARAVPVGWQGSVPVTPAACWQCPTRLLGQHQVGQDFMELLVGGALLSTGAPLAEGLCLSHSARLISR